MNVYDWPAHGIRINSGEGSSKLARVKVNLPLLFAAYVLPDVDMIWGFLVHLGPTAPAHKIKLKIVKKYWEAKAIRDIIYCYLRRTNRSDFMKSFLNLFLIILSENFWRYFY